MKRLLTFVASTFLASMGFSQSQQFEIVKIGSEYSQGLILETMQKTDLCGMINPSQSYIIKLNDGAEVKIKSANETIGTYSSECVRATDVIEQEVNWFIKGDAILIKSVNTKTIKKS